MQVSLGGVATIYIYIYICVLRQIFSKSQGNTWMLAQVESVDLSSAIEAGVMTGVPVHSAVVSYIDGTTGQAMKEQVPIDNLRRLKGANAVIVTANHGEFRLVSVEGQPSVYRWVEQLRALCAKSSTPTLAATCHTGNLQQLVAWVGLVRR